MLPLGRCVGGSTTVNSGTCFRIPGWILKEWREEQGLTMFTEEYLEPYYRRVESTLGVATVRPEVLGDAARTIARGSERLHFRSGPIKRNAPDCEGKGLCCFGCPTDAKRSTNISYVPLALKSGAMLYTGIRVERVLVRNGKSVGVTGTCKREDGTTRRLTVRAPVVVLACGTLLTPPLLQRSGCCTESPYLGKNLSLHPASAVVGLFTEPIRGWKGVPQGYAVEAFHREGILIENGFFPLDFAALGVPLMGPDFTELMESYNHIVNLGYFICDTSRGSVRAAPGNQFLVTYNLNDFDVARLQKGLIHICEILFAAGAKKVYPIIHGFDTLESERDLVKLRRASLKAHDFELSAFHPLGTTRMGLNPETSVIGTNHETHEIANLFICDGGAIPSSVAVNCQIAIMTFATRAAEFIDHRIRSLSNT
jgi:choline dehydrogenase-like flavoprotein